MPAQTGLADGTMATLTGNNGFTVMVTMFDAAGLSMAQVAFEVSTQAMVLLLAGIMV